MIRLTRGMPRAAWCCILGGIMAAMPAVSYALGLGNLTVDSALNESLKAEIEFTSASRNELKSLNVTLAPRGQFEAAGIEWLPYLSDVKFTVARRLDGRSFIQLTSEQPIREPFLHFLLQAEWAGGRLTREFTALIDPPYLLAGRAPPVNVPRTRAPEVAPSAAPAMTAGAPEATAGASAEPLPAPPADMAAAEPAAEPQPAPTMPTEPEPIATAAIEPEPATTTVRDEDLLGPPEMGDSSVAISADTGWPVVASVAPPTAIPAQTEVAITESLGAPGPGWATVSQYEVKRGDTLWRIAETIRVDQNLTIQQVVMALYEANRDAFFGDNVNNVWAGEVLMIPERPEVQVLSAPDARRVFMAQYDDWQAYKIKLASANQTIKVVDEPAAGAQTGASVADEGGPSVASAEQAVMAAQQEPTQARTAKPQEQEQEQPSKAQQVPQKPEAGKSEGSASAAVAAKARPPGDLLKIVRATIKRESAGKTGKPAEGESIFDSEQAERLALAERATTLDESLESRQMQQQELGERIGTVGSQIQKEKRLIELENESLAQAQPDAAAPPDKAAGAAKAPTGELAGAGAAAKKAAPAKPKPQAKPAVTAKKKPAQAKSASKPQKRKRRRIAPPPQPEEPGILATIQGMVGDYLMQAVAAVVALAGGLILLTYLRRRRQAEAEFEESILTDTGATTEEPVTGESGSQATTSAGNTSFLSDFSQGGMGNISTDEVDPLAETEVYLAYGRDEQAEEILKEAVTKDPSRHELKVKLLEIYSQRSDVAAFETLAEELYAALEGRGGDLWNNVADMGRRLNPDNPMFHGAAPAGQLSVPEPIPVAPEMPPVTSMEEPESPPGLDFEPVPDAVSAKAEADMGIDDSALGLDTDAGAGEAVDSELEFDLDMDTAAAASEEGGPHLGDTSELAAQDMGVSAAAEAAQAEAELGLGEGPAENVVDFDIPPVMRRPTRLWWSRNQALPPMPVMSSGVWMPRRSPPRRRLMRSQTRNRRRKTRNNGMRPPPSSTSPRPTWTWVMRKVRAVSWTRFLPRATKTRRNKPRSWRRRSRNA